MTADIWTSLAREAFLGVTCHFLTEDWKMKTLILATMPLEEANTKLKEKQKQMNTPDHKLIQDVSTRWNSTYFMVERLLEQHWPITAALSDPE